MMSAQALLAMFGVLFGGVALAVQAPLNAALSRIIGDPGAAALVSFGVGMVILALMLVFRGELSSLVRLAQVPWWAWLGGLCGAFYVTAVIFGVPRLGVVTTIAVLVAGQLVTALVLDAIGAFGVPVHPVSWQRVIAVLLVGAGVYLSRVY